MKKSIFVVLFLFTLYLCLEWMKRFSFSVVLLVSFLIFGCHQKNAEATKKSGTTKMVEADAISQHQKKTDSLSDFRNLYPIEIVNPNSKDPYRKFGLEFSRNYYACDLAEIKVHATNLYFVNVCDENDFYRIEKISYSVTSNELKIITDKNEFTFVKIENCPIYELKIKGSPISIKDKRLSKYYTQKKLVNRFEQHDYGDFEG